MKSKIILPIPYSFLLLLWLILIGFSQDPVLFQGFYWDVPAGGVWWDTLRTKAPTLDSAGIDMIWFPSPFKGAGGGYDMGYGIYDHYDAGEFDQNGTVETRFGSKAELLAAIAAYHNSGMQVICDVVLNHVYGGDLEANPDVEDYIKNKSWYPVYPYDRYAYVYENAPAGRYYVQVKGNKYDHTQTSYVDNEGYYALRPWFSNSTGQNANGQPHWYEWQIGDGDSGPFDAFRIDLPGRIMEGEIDANESDGKIDEYYIDHTGGWLEFKLWSTDYSGTRDFIIPQLWYDPDTTQSGDDYDVSANLKIYSYTRIQPASGKFPKDHSYYHPTTSGHDDIFETYHYPYFGNDLCLANSTVLAQLKAWGEWLTDSLGFDGYRFDLAKGIEPYYMAQWINDPVMSERYYVAEHWSSADEIKAWVDATNSFISGSHKITAFDFPLFYALKSFCDDDGYDARNLHSAGLYPKWNHGLYITTFVHNHDVFRPYTNAHNPIVHNAELAYAYILTHPGTATVFYPDYFGGTFYNSDSSESFTMSGMKSLIDNLIRIRKHFVSGNFYRLTEVGSPDYKPGNNPYASGDFSAYASKVYVAQREGGTGTGNLGGCIVVLNKSQSDTIGVWVTVQGNGVGASFLRDQTGHRTGIARIYEDNRVFVHAAPRSFSVWADSSYYLWPAVSLKIFLEGAYDSATGEMRTTLRDAGLLPQEQPYSAAPWNYTGGEAVQSIPSGVVDWVLLELRKNPAADSRVVRRAAFLRKDGKIVDLDGVSAVSFKTSPGEYYVVVHHRNHLSVMSTGPLSLNVPNKLFYDFSDQVGRAYSTGPAPLKQLASGVFGMLAGDANADGAVDAIDYNSEWFPNNGTSGIYPLNADLNLDGSVNTTDAQNYWLPNNGQATQVPQ